MTDAAGPPGPALPPDLLADLHAGVLDEQLAAGLRARVRTDPRAREVLAALDATLADLRALPAPVIPGDVAARLDAALAEEARAARPAAPVARPAAPVARPAAVADLASRRRPTGWGGVGLLVAAAAVVVGIVALGTGPLETAGSPRAERPTLALSGGDVRGGLDDALGAVDLGPLSQPAALRACLDANGIPPPGKPLGAREVTLDGRPGVLLVLPTGEIAQFRLLVVGPGCGPGNPSLLADDVVGR